MSKKSIIWSALVALSLLSASEVSSAQVVMTTGSSPANIDNFSEFIPRPQRSTKIDYDVWDSLVEELVLYTGPSARVSLPTPQPILGSRFVRGHKSAYRLEGNRIPYSRINAEFIDVLTDYRKDLEEVGTQVNISTLSKNEQLAYWLNLHNAVIIEQIAKAYPLRRPIDLKIGEDKLPLHDAKIIDIKGKKISLRDIRENIVYPNWKNPKVIYGFYLGDIGSPSMQNSAFTADNVSQVLDRSASEFINSLRGFRVRNKNQFVSRLYTDVAKFYFTDFANDVRNHITPFMRDDVRSQIMTTKDFKTDRYDSIIADLTAGQGAYSSISQLERTDRNTISLQGANPYQRFFDELVSKRESLKKRGLIQNGVVIIEDIPTIDPDSPEGKDIDLEP